MKEAFWTVEFRSGIGPQSLGFGVLVSKEGKIFGGDGSFTYSGTYSVIDGTIKATVNVAKYAPGNGNILGMDNYTLEVQGKDTGDNLQLDSHPTGQPHLKLQIHCKLKETF